MQVIKNPSLHSKNYEQGKMVRQTAGHPQTFSRLIKSKEKTMETSDMMLFFSLSLTNSNATMLITSRMIIIYSVNIILRLKM